MKKATICIALIGLIACSQFIVCQDGKHPPGGGNQENGGQQQPQRPNNGQGQQPQRPNNGQGQQPQRPNHGHGQQQPPRPNHGHPRPPRPNGGRPVWNPNQPWYGNHWVNPWNGYYYPVYHPGPIGNWRPPRPRPPHHSFYPWDAYYNSYNYADKYAYDFFQRNGYTIQSVYAFCYNDYIQHIINQSRAVKRFCDYFKKVYASSNYPKAS
uniref:Translation initiation factor IF-2 n=1 Tax=Parastrongyloides trichosuri TaxID=131310 RepID=A0A0N5A3V8_PARTI